MKRFLLVLPALLWMILAADVASTLKVVWRDKDPAVQVVYALNVCGLEVTVNGTTFAEDVTDMGPYECIGNKRSEPEATLKKLYRVSDSPFRYDLPVPTDGHYVLHLQFGEAVRRPCDIFLNGIHKLSSINVHFQIVDGQLLYRDEVSEITDERSISLEFAPIPESRASIASILLVKGELADLRAAKWIPDDACPRSETEYQTRVLKLLTNILSAVNELKERN